MSVILKKSSKFASSVRKSLHAKLSSRIDDDEFVVLGGKREKFSSVPTMISCTSDSEFELNADEEAESSSGSSTSTPYAELVHHGARPLPIEVSCSEDWTRLNKVKTIQEIGGSLKRLEKVMEEVEQELYHKKLLMKLRYHRYRTDESAACKVTMFDNPF